MSDERQGCSQGVRHQRKGMCTRMDLVSLAHMSGLKVGLILGRAIKDKLSCMSAFSLCFDEPPAGNGASHWR